jgi:hypothetical protein
MNNVAQINPSIVYEPSQTTHWKNLFPNKTMLLGSHNLNEGEELVAKIRHVEIQAIKNASGKDDKVPVVNFENAPPMVLNITNARTISSLYGERYADWKGQSIQLYVTMVRGYGTAEKVQGLRIRTVIPQTNENVQQYINNMRACTTLGDLQVVFTSIPKHLKPGLVAEKDVIKKTIGASNVQG